MSEPERVALVTGGTHGLGFETARQLARHGMTVIITSADALVGKAAADKLQSEGLTVRFHLLDTRREEAIIRLRQWLVANTGRLDVLVNNGEHSDDDTENSILTVELERLREGLEASAFNGLRLAQELIPIMSENAYGRIVNVGATAGRLSRMGKGAPVHRFSRAALHAITAMIGAELAATPIRVNAVDPGDQADAGVGDSAGDNNNTEQAAASIVAAAQVPADGPSGCLLQHGEAVPW